MGAVNKMMRVAATVSTMVRRDGWYNVLTGLGVAGKDKRMSMNYVWQRFTETELEHLYATDPIARRIVEYVPNEGTRKWIELRMEDGSEESAKAMSEEMTRLRVQEKFNEAWNWARLYGGAGVLMVVEDGRQLSEPMDLTKVSEVKSLTVLNRFELNTDRLIDDLKNPDFGKQEVYSLSSSGNLDNTYNRIHHSRIIRFDGMPLPRRLFEINDSWNDSVLPKVLNALRNYNSAHDSVAAAVQDFRLTILKLKNLADMVGSDDDKVLLARLQMMNLSKGVLNSVAIDADNEDITHIGTEFSNLDTVLSKVEQRLVGDSDLPHTVVLGEGATGTLGGGGQSEDRNAKDFVAAQQEKVLTRPVERIMEVIMAAKRGPFSGAKEEGLTWSFKPLWQMSEKEKAEVHKTQAEADIAYITEGVLSPETVARSRFGGSEYTTETKMEEAHEEGSDLPPPAQPKPEEAATVDADETSYDHSHFVSLEAMGSGYTSGANGEGANHTHTMPNGVETGPAIELFGGGHIHLAAVSSGGEKHPPVYTSPGFPKGVVGEAQAIAEEEEEETPGTIELELDIKTGKFSFKSVPVEQVQSAVVEDTMPRAEADKLFKRFDSMVMSKAGDGWEIPLQNPKSFKEGTLKRHPTNIKGVFLMVGELK